MTAWGVSNDLLQVVILVLTAVVAYFLKGLVAEVKEMKAGQQACKLSLSKEFQAKGEAEDDSKRQWERIDEHSEAIAACNQRHNSHEKRLDKLETLYQRR